MPLEIIDEVRPRKQERATLREIVLMVYNSIGILCLLFLIALAATWPTNANAGPMAQTVTQEGAKIMLTDEPCTLKEVSNLKYRATWLEKGKLFEGCYAVHPFGVVVAYFSDGAVALMPLDVFQKVTGV